MNLGALFPGIGTAPAATGAVGGIGSNWLIWLLIILLIVWYGRSGFGFGNCYPNYGYSRCGYPPGYGYPPGVGGIGTGPFGGNIIWFIVIIFLLIWCCGGYKLC